MQAELRTLRQDAPAAEARLIELQEQADARAAALQGQVDERQEQLTQTQQQLADTQVSDSCNE